MVAAVVTCWTAQCARLLTHSRADAFGTAARGGRSPGHRGRLRLLADVLGSAPPFRPDFVAHTVLSPGGVVVDESSLVTVIMRFLAVAAREFGTLLVWSTTALWLVPLTAWMDPPPGVGWSGAGFRRCGGSSRPAQRQDSCPRSSRFTTLLVPLGSRDFSSQMTHLATVVAALRVGRWGPRRCRRRSGPGTACSW